MMLLANEGEDDERRLLWPGRTHTCRVCKATYTDAENGPCACRHHPGELRGESARKGEWTAAIGRETGWKGGDVFFHWNCCGRHAEAKGCALGRHTSYDDAPVDVGATGAGFYYE